MAEYTNEQQLLMHLRDAECRGNAAELARKIGKDPTYVSRLFYPIGKKARKSIGLEIMQSCTKAFSLPPGFWERPAKSAEAYPAGTDTFPTQRLDINSPGVVFLPKPKPDKWILRANEILSQLNEAQRAACVVNLELYLAAVGPPKDGQTLSVAG